MSASWAATAIHAAATSVMMPTSRNHSSIPMKTANVASSGLVGPRENSHPAPICTTTIAPPPSSDPGQMSRHFSEVPERKRKSAASASASMANATSRAAARPATSYQNEFTAQPKQAEDAVEGPCRDAAEAAPSSSATPKTTAASRSRAFISTYGRGSLGSAKMSRTA